MFKYVGSVIIRYELRNLTGLRIGGSKENFEIGGLDNPVIKTLQPIEKYDGKNTLPEGAPYIPGSSLKGKIRSLLEWAKGRVEWMIKNKNDVENGGKPCDCGKCEICIIFGTSDAKTIDSIKNIEELPGPPRLRVFDAYPTWDSLKAVEQLLGSNIYTEVKTENAINRLTSRANPRKVERVPAGMLFFGEMVFHMFREEDKKLFKTVLEGMRLLEDDYLGGYGSRGSGRVRFESVKLIFRPKEYYTDNAQEKLLGEFSSVSEAIDKRIDF